MTPRWFTHRILGSALVLGLAAALSACESQSSTSTGPTPVKCQVSVQAPSDSVAPVGGKGAVSVTAAPECSWTASPGAAWITGLTPSSGQGNGRVEFQTSDNPAGTMRQSYISINDQQAQVQQQPAPCRFEVSPRAPTMNAAGGTIAVTVSTLTGCQWQASGGASWLSLASTSGSGNGTVNLRVSANEDREPRTAAVVVAGQSVTVTQAAPAGTPLPPPTPAPPGSCVFSLDRATESVSAAGGSATVAVSGPATCPWTAASSASWITVMAGASGTGAGAVTFSVAPNTGASRTGTLTIAGRAFTVVQAAASPAPTPPPPPPAPTPPPPPPAPTPTCSYSISPTSREMGEKGGSVSVAVSAGSGCSWTAVSNVSWITITAGAIGIGDGTVAFEVERGKKRTGTLTIAGQTFTVTQAD